jgi:hypothetical protein
MATRKELLFVLGALLIASWPGNPTQSDRRCRLGEALSAPLVLQRLAINSSLFAAMDICVVIGWAAIAARVLQFSLHQQLAPQQLCAAE